MNKLIFFFGKIFLKVVDITPYWFWKIFFIFSNKNKIKKLEIKAKEIKLDKVIWLDFNGYVGDFFSVLKAIINYDKKNEKYVAFVNEKFKGIIEDLNLKNCNKIFYKKTIVDRKNINIDNLIEIGKFNINEIILLNPIVPSDLSCFLLVNNCKKITKINPKISNSFFMNRRTNSSFLSQRNLINDLFFLSNKKKFNFSKYIKYKENKSVLFLANELLNNNENNKYNIKNNKANKSSILFTIGASRSDKVLKQNYIQEILRDKQISLVGTTSDLRFIDHLKIDNKLITDISLFDLYNLVKKSDKVISYDTGLYHIANFLNKNTILILNESFISWKYMKEFWFGDANKNVKKILLEDKYFQ